MGSGPTAVPVTGNIQVDADHLERPGNVVIDREPDAAMRAATCVPISTAVNSPTGRGRCWI